MILYKDPCVHKSEYIVKNKSPTHKMLHQHFQQTLQCNESIVTHQYPKK